MTNRHGLWVVVVFLTAALAGCLGADGPGPEPAGSAPVTGTPPAPPARPTPTTGALAGVVRAADLSPLVEATVFVGRVDETAQHPPVRSDASGRFTLDGLTPGRYVVQAAAWGHEPGQAEAEVVAAQVTAVQMILSPFAPVEPYSVRRDDDGFMAVGWGAAGASHSMDGGDPNHATVFEFDVVPAALETLLLRVAWDDPATVLAVDLWYNVTCSPCQAEHTYASATGNGEILVRLDRPAGGWPGLQAPSDRLWLFAWPGSTEDRPASVAYQVPFTVAFEAFYHEAAPDGHVLLGDG